MRRWTLPSRAEQGRVTLSGAWTTSTCYKPREIERPWITATFHFSMRSISAVIRSSPVAGLCYDTPSGEAMPFLLGLPETFPRALSSDCSQETCPSQPLGERLRRNNRLLEACIEGKVRLYRCEASKGEGRCDMP